MLDLVHCMRDLQDAQSVPAWMTLNVGSAGRQRHRVSQHARLCTLYERPPRGAERASMYNLVRWITRPSEAQSVPACSTLYTVQEAQSEPACMTLYVGSSGRQSHRVSQHPGPCTWYDRPPRGAERASMDDLVRWISRPSEAQSVPACSTLYTV